jgi:glycerophosphoryl diester phosphodiesterase
MLLVAACSNQLANVKSPQVNNEDRAFQQALAARGFYSSARGNINYLQDKQCGGYQLQSHRGAVRFPENSLNAVIDALDNHFDVVEIDVRVTSDDEWVVHHDLRTGRESGTIDNRRMKVESINYGRAWGYLRSRDQHTGQLLDIVPPNFRQMAAAFTQKASSNQLLNIEIKTNANKRELELLDYLAFSIIGQGRYFYSSLKLKNLERMRGINDEVFLSFIQRPAKRSMDILSREINKGVATDPIFLRHQDLLEDIVGSAKRNYRERRHDDARGIRKLKKSLTHHYGLAVDIRHFAKQSRQLMRLAQQYSIPIATYTINGQDYHAKTLLSLKERHHPTSVIIDDTIYGFCSQYGLPPLRVYKGTTPMTKRLASLPQDLDLESLDELNTYYSNGLYPSVSGQLTSINGNIPSDLYPSVILNTTAGPKQASTDVRLDTKKVIKIDLRKGQ